MTVGFTAGIAVIIFASQLKELFGLTLAGKEPGELLPKLPALWAARDSVNPAAVVVVRRRRSRSSSGCAAGGRTGRAC